MLSPLYRQSKQPVIESSRLKSSFPAPHFSHRIIWEIKGIDRPSTNLLQGPELAGRGGEYVRLRCGLGLLLVVAFWFTALWPIVAHADDTAQQQRIEQSRNRYLLGRMYEQAGDLTRAEENFQQALEFWPDNQDARIALQHLIDQRNPPVPPQTFWFKWFSWLGTGTGSGSYLSSIMEIFGWIVMVVVFAAIFLKFGMETIRLAIRRAKGVPLLGLGLFTDPTGRLPGLAHQLATNMNDAGLTIYDEKGAVPPDFNFIGDTGFPQAKLLVKVLDMVYQRQVERIHVEISIDDGMLNASVSLVDSANGYVRYLHVVSVPLADFNGTGELTKVVAQLIADAILISLSLDPNTRGLLYQRLGDWTSALKEFSTASDLARKKNLCATYYQAHLNLGNLYSFLGLQDKSIAAYNEVAEKAQNPVTLALIYAAMACSYKNWQAQSQPDQQPTYDWLARQAIEKALTSPAKTPLIAYTIACYYSLSHQIEECLRWMREAVSGDLDYLDYAMSDPDLDYLRHWLDGRTLGEALGLRVG
jgi:tetratricopeptide (TPR) repeat protein